MGAYNRTWLALLLALMLLFSAGFAGEKEDELRAAATIRDVERM